MEEIFLEAEPRQELRRAGVKGLRKEGFVPAVVYCEGSESFPIKVSSGSLLRLIHQHRIESAVINLTIKEDKKKKARSCLIKEIQYDPVHGDILHVDFNEISMTKLIKVNVPVVAKGEPVGVKQEGGSLEHILWEIEIECLPTDIPKEIAVDISQLKLAGSIHVKDLPVPANIRVLNDPEAVVLSVAAPMKEEVPVAPLEGEEAKEPEVIKEKKEAPVEGEEEPVKEKEKEKEKK